MISLNPNVWGLGVMVTYSRAQMHWPAGLEVDLQIGPANIYFRFTRHEKRRSNGSKTRRWNDH